MTEKPGNWWDRRTYGPLMALPYPARFATLQSVMAGRAVDDPARADLAVEFAGRRAKLLGGLCIFAAFVVVFDLFVAVLDQPSLAQLSGVTCLFLGPMWFYQWSHVRRFLRVMTHERRGEVW